MKRSESSRPIEVTLAELHQLCHRIEQRLLEERDWPLVAGLVSNLIARTEARQDNMRAKVESASDVSATPVVIDAEFTSRDVENQSGANTPEQRPAGGTDGAPSGSGPQPKGKPKGHGRTGAAAYAEKATHVFHKLVGGVIGMICAVCSIGRMVRYREKVIIRVIGQSNFAAEAHHFEQARCNNCHRIVRADGSVDVLVGLGSSYITYDWSACAMLLFLHYFSTTPLKRLDSMHAGWGVPMPDSNLWKLADQCDDLLLPMYRALERYGIAKAESLRIDDTGAEIIETRRRIKAELEALEAAGEPTKDLRTAINATGVYLETKDEKIILFYTGRHHAGEMLDQLLEHRHASSEKLAKVTDGAAKNFDHNHRDKLAEGTCNTHSFLKFRAIKDKYPLEYATVGAIYDKIYENEDEVKRRKLGKIERRDYHREHSKPLMLKLKEFCDEKIRTKTVEPASALWEPVTFVINQWSRLILFCEEPGVPLDTNLVEQQLIIPLRYLAASFNYHTETGAEVGDRAMSLIATARANDVEAVAFLKECLSNHEDLAKRPEHYFPWVVRERLKKSPSAPASSVEARAGPQNSESTARSAPELIRNPDT
jgi:hypothetical protein